MSLKQLSAYSRIRAGVMALLIVLAAVALSINGRPAAASPAGMSQAAADAARSTDQIIVRFRTASDPTAMPAAAAVLMLDRLSDAAGVQLTLLRPMSGDAYVFRLPSRLPQAEVAAISRDLAALPEVAHAEPDAVLQAIGNPPPRAGTAWETTPRSAPQAVNAPPDDPDFADQWHYRYTPDTEEGINLLPAWDLTTGSATTVVAVIDTGIRPHADLSGRTVPGYDFIADTFVANDGNGRDADASDPGDWYAANQCAPGVPGTSSSWHGTHVAGTIGAASDNGSDVAGVNWNAKILPVRVLGRCGGYLSDIIDGMRWAAGLAVPGVPPNPNPADVLNLSLGGSGSCAGAYQDAFNAVDAAGVVAVVAAGNSSANANAYRPANCEKVITVSATTYSGDRAYYSNYGPVVEVSAPGGETDLFDSDGILSTLNDGAAGPGNDSLAFYQGTSMAAPHVAGVVSLLLGEKPDLQPEEVLDLLETTARDFPNGSNCTTTNCGEGIVDAYAALTTLAGTLDAPALVAPADGTTVNTATPPIEWSAVAGADNYNLEISLDAGFFFVETDVEINATTYTPDEPLVNDTYYWRVRAIDEGVPGLWSEVWSFTVDAGTVTCDPPGVPLLTAPVDGATTGATPTYSYYTAVETPEYELRVDNDVDFSSPVLEVVTSETTYQDAAPLAAGAYYWSARGLNRTGGCDEASEWSEVWSFTVEEDVACDAPDIPTLIAPGHGSLVDDATPLFSWNAAANANWYNIYVDDNPDLSSPIIAEPTQDLIYAPDTPLSPGGYYWAVAGSNYTEGECDVLGELSEIRGFIVEGQAVGYQLYLPAVVSD